MACLLRIVVSLAAIHFQPDNITSRRMGKVIVAMGIVRDSVSSLLTISL